ncbi:MAG: GNAT family N-acetyltransferase [Alphaproteobacteria bacterium]
MITGVLARDDAIGQIEIVEDLPGIDAVAAPWRALEARTAERSTFFQSYAWCRAVVDLRHRSASSSGRPFIVTLRRDGGIQALWPLALFRQGPCRFLRALDDPFGQFAQPLVDPALDAHAAIAAMVGDIRRRSPADGLLITKIADRSPLRPALTAEGANLTLSDQAVFLDLSAYGDFETYQKTVNVKTRKNLRNARNRLTRDHTIEHEVTTDRDRLAAIIKEATDGRAAWMQAEGKTSPAFRDDLFAALLAALPSTEPSLGLIGFRLKAEERVIAVQWGFLHRNCYYAYLSARDRGFDQYSAGRIHLGMIIEACAKRGIERIEMMSPPSEYKLQWTKSLTRIDDVMLPLTQAGRLYRTLWHSGLREALKQTYYRLPQGLKKRLSQTSTA